MEIIYPRADFIEVSRTINWSLKNVCQKEHTNWFTIQNVFLKYKNYYLLYLCIKIIVLWGLNTQRCKLIIFYFLKVYIWQVSKIGWIHILRYVHSFNTHMLTEARRLLIRDFRNTDQGTRPLQSSLLKVQNDCCGGDGVSFNSVFVSGKTIVTTVWSITTHITRRTHDYNYCVCYYEAVKKLFCTRGVIIGYVASCLQEAPDSKSRSYFYTIIIICCRGHMPLANNVWHFYSSFYSGMCLIKLIIDMNL